MNVFKLNLGYVFVNNYITLKIMGPEQYAKIPKGKKATVWVHFIPKNEKKMYDIKYGDI